MLPHPQSVHRVEVIEMTKSHDTKKDKKKPAQKTAKEKRQEKREKKRGP
jgi:hypothetical protein